MNSGILTWPGDHGRPDGRGNTVAPGVTRTPGPAASHACGTRKPRQGPAVPPGRPREAGRKGSPVPGGNRTLGSRQQVSRDAPTVRHDWTIPRSPIMEAAKTAKRVRNENNHGPTKY